MPGSSTHPTRVVNCPQCGDPLPVDSLEFGFPFECPRCRSRLLGALFPALAQPSTRGTNSAETALEGDATCFFHPEQKATLACERCGRFVCALCDLELGTRRLCPACLGHVLDGEKIPELVNSRVCWSNIAILLGLVPIFIGITLWPLLIFTAAAAIFAAIFGWKKPGSLVNGQRHWLAVLSIFGALAQMVGWLALALLIWK